MEEYTYNGKKALRNKWEIGDIGYILAFTKAKVLKTNMKKLFVEYVEKSNTQEIGHTTWINRCNFAKSRRTDYNGPKST